MPLFRMFYFLRQRENVSRTCTILPQLGTRDTTTTVCYYDKRSETQKLLGRVITLSLCFFCFCFFCIENLYFCSAGNYLLVQISVPLIHSETMIRKHTESQKFARKRYLPFTCFFCCFFLCIENSLICSARIYLPVQIPVPQIHYETIIRRQRRQIFLLDENPRDKIYTEIRNNS